MIIMQTYRFEWATKGLYLGQRRGLLQLHVDDWYVCEFGAFFGQS